MRLDNGATGTVLVPSLLGAVLAKAAATGIAVRAAKDRDWQDAAFLLTLPIEPADVLSDVRRSDRRLLNRLRPLLNSQSPHWRAFDPGDRDRAIDVLSTLLTAAEEHLRQEE